MNTQSVTPFTLVYVKDAFHGVPCQVATPCKEWSHVVVETPPIIEKTAPYLYLCSDHYAMIRDGLLPRTEETTLPLKTFNPSTGQWERYVIENKMGVWYLWTPKEATHHD